MSIDELKIAKSNEGSGQLEVLRQHLTGNQVDEIVQILSLKSKKKAKPQLQKLLANLKAPVLSKILGDFLIGSNK